MSEPSRTELRAVVDEVLRVKEQAAERAAEGNHSAEGYLVAVASHQADVDPGEVRPVIREALRERRRARGAE